jgi:hypothetical protein
MLIIRKNKDGIVTGGYSVRFNLVHIYIILQILSLVVGLYMNVSWYAYLLPTLVFSVVLGVIILLAQIGLAIDRAVRMFKGEKFSLYKIFYVLMVATWILEFVCNKLGITFTDSTPLLILVLNFDIAFMSILVFCYALLVTISFSFHHASHMAN